MDLRREYRWFVWSFIVLNVLSPSHALGPYFNLESLSKSESWPIVIESNSGHMDHNTGVIRAPKGMTIWHGDSKLTANRMCYDTQHNRATARGNVCIMNAQGMICICRHATIDWTNRTGRMQGVRAFPHNENGLRHNQSSKKNRKLN